ncbi:Methylmalonyl-CoA carboxyltransferase 12S subunit [Paraconexibacter sp. AEG42_29]|uniref:Methylmalonyl-CoA carboxyltransferase 12S subunit n=1 Tax=Paraconexibacter sp. AEG42_29 TaxID=2997339 RepID=A0AAU7B111_9ACTN
MTPPALQLAPRPDEKLTALERLEVLCDPGSIHLLRTAVRSTGMGERAVAGDGVLTASARVDGRPIFCFAQDPSFIGGSLGAAHADSIVAVMRAAGRARVPLIGFVQSAGARLQEGTAALGGYGRIFREHVALSGVIPQISIICGACAGGGSYAPALTDFIVMTESAAMFLTGPAIVKEVTGEDVDATGLGGPKVHGRNGVVHMTAPTEVDAALLARDILDHLPQHSGAAVQRWPSVDPPGRAPDSILPAQDRQVYDVRDVAKSLVDGGRILEVQPKFAKNVVCAMARLDGRAIGIVANQPRYLGGVLDASSAQKASRFIRTCNIFGLPLLVLVDTPGFLPGVKQEEQGVIRHGAKLVYAFAEAQVPKVTVMLRKAYGGAFIAMNSKDLGADLVLAWPGAQLGVMGPKQAVGITQRRAIAAADDPDATRDRLADEYTRDHLDVSSAAAGGFVDEVIAPHETRARLIAAYAGFEGHHRTQQPTGNVPL